MYGDFYVNLYLISYDIVILTINNFNPAYYSVFLTCYVSNDQG